MKTSTTTTRKERNRNRKRAVGNALKTGAKIAGGVMAVSANPTLVGAAAKAAGLTYAGGVAGGVVRGVKEKVRKLKNKMRNRKKNPNRKRL